MMQEQNAENLPGAAGGAAASDDGYSFLRGESDPVGQAGAPNKPRQGKPDNLMREARQKLTHQTEMRPEFLYELLQIFARNELIAALMLPMLALVVALAFTRWTDPLYAGVWFGAVFLSTLILVWFSRSFLKTPRHEIRVNRWRKRLTAAELLHGLSWASLALLAPFSADPRAQMLVFTTLTVIVAMRMMFANAASSIAYAGALPLTLALVVRFSLQEEAFYWAMAGLAFGIHLFFLHLMTEQNTTALTMLELKAQKDDLIAELEEAKSMAEEGRRRAEQANMAKSRFLATMSHELRTPLNAILGFSEMMKDEMLGKHEVAVYKEYSGNIHHSGQHLLNLINEVLDLSRIEAGRYELHEEAIDLALLAEDCHKLMQLRAESRQLRIIEAFAEDLPMVWGDRRALRQICLNLLSNAIKFTPLGGEIILAVGRGRNGEQFLSVKDNGPGIPEDEIPTIMSRFGQGSLAHETAEGGTGLGLPIVKGLIELHDGEFELQSRLREGTEVVIALPPKRVMEAMPPLDPTPMAAQAGRRYR